MSTLCDKSSSQSRVVDKIQRIAQLLVDFDKSIYDKYPNYYPRVDEQEWNRSNCVTMKMSASEYQNSFSKDIHNILDIFNLCTQAVCKQLNQQGNNVVSVFVKHLMVQYRKCLLLSLRVTCSYNNIEYIFKENKFRVSTKELQKDLFEEQQTFKFGQGKQEVKYQKRIIEKNVIEIIEDDFKEEKDIFPDKLKELLGYVQDPETGEYIDMKALMEQTLSNKNKFLEMEASGCVNLMTHSLKGIEVSVNRITKLEEEATENNKDKQLENLLAGNSEQFSQNVRDSLEVYSEKKMKGIVSQIVNNIKTSSMNKRRSASCQTETPTECDTETKQKTKKTISFKNIKIISEKKATCIPLLQEVQRELELSQKKIAKLTEELEKTRKDLWSLESKRDFRVGQRESENQARDIKMKLERQARQREKAVQTEEQSIEILSEDSINHLNSFKINNESINPRIHQKRRNESSLEKVEEKPIFGIFMQKKSQSRSKENIYNSIEQQSACQQQIAINQQHIFKNCDAFELASIMRYLFFENSSESDDAKLSQDKREQMKPIKLIIQSLLSRKQSEWNQLCEKVTDYLQISYSVPNSFKTIDKSAYFTQPNMKKQHIEEFPISIKQPIKILKKRSSKSLYSITQVQNQNPLQKSNNYLPFQTLSNDIEKDNLNPKNLRTIHEFQTSNSNETQIIQSQSTEINNNEISFIKNTNQSFTQKQVNKQQFSDVKQFIACKSYSGIKQLTSFQVDGNQYSLDSQSEVKKVLKNTLMQINGKEQLVGQALNRRKTISSNKLNSIDNSYQQ